MTDGSNIPSSILRTKEPDDQNGDNHRPPEKKTPHHETRFGEFSISACMIVIPAAEKCPSAMSRANIRYKQYVYRRRAYNRRERGHAYIILYALRVRPFNLERRGKSGTTIRGWGLNRVGLLMARLYFML